MPETYSFVEPPDGTVVRVTREEILQTYFPYWKQKMQEANRPPEEIMEDNCIEDWVIVHWAHKEADDES